jgi:hypothetical protein
MADRWRTADGREWASAASLDAARRDVVLLEESRRALAQALMDKEQRLAEFEAVVLEMHHADDNYGCGFYGEDTWLKPYNKLRVMVGLDADPLWAPDEEPTP